jgi:peptidoglycan hydrolase-like protein with peptidoglycan-binding domain
MVLKRGDNNEIVKKVQIVLGVDPVGNFGPKTEEAVKAWQKKNGLPADGIVGPATLAKMGIIVEEKTPTKPSAAPAKPSAAVKYSKAKIEEAVKAKGYKWFEGKDYHLNIVGVRNSDTGQKVTNAFDDRLTLSYQVNGEWIYKEWMNTTDPGTKGVKEYHNAAGVARLVEGQYIDSHALGLHQGKYEALKQQKAVKVYRDANRDMTYDESKIQEGIFGINIHKAGADSTYVENWSEGCQVFKKSADFEAFMVLARKAAAIHGKSFTYTLIESSDIK